MDFLRQHKGEASPSPLTLCQTNLRVRTRRTRLFGLWVAELLDFNAQNASQYVEDLLLVDLTGGCHALLERAHQDLLSANIYMSETSLQHHADRFWTLATEGVREL